MCQLDPGKIAIKDTTREVLGRATVGCIARTSIGSSLISNNMLVQLRYMNSKGVDLPTNLLSSRFNNPLLSKIWTTKSFRALNATLQY
jgi:hypothetical protein